MKLIQLFQSKASSLLTLFATVFDFLGQLPFFVILFSFIFLLCNKNSAFKFWLTYCVGFVIGSLALKNIIKRQRPYVVNEGLLATHNSYSGSMPSAASMLVGENVCYTYISSNKNLSKISKVFTIIALLILAIGCCLSQIYFAKNYLLDVIVGFVLAIIISLLINKFVKLKGNFSKYFLFIFAPMLVILLLIHAGQLFTNNFANVVIVEFVGISLSVILGFYIEEKYIKYEIKNNLFFTTFKVAIILISLIAYYYLCYFILPGMLIFSFIKYFVVGLYITIILPLVFKKVEKYFYIFTKSVDSKKVKMSAITLSCNGTKKIAKKIYSSLNNGDVILLSGDLGAGKSVLVRGVLTCAGVNKAITSPTFTLVNEYKTASNHFYHFDMYRIEDEQEVINIGFEEIIEDKNSIKFIEWPEKVENYLPKKYKKLTIIKLGNNSRNIILEEFEN